MKKIIKTLFCVFVLAISAVFITACNEENHHEHAWGEWAVIAEPDCYNQGVKQRVCTLDSTHVEQESIPQTHNGNFICKDCYRPIVEEISSDFYVNLFYSSFTTPLALVVNDVDFNFTSEDGCFRYKINFAELSIFFNEQNELCGFGNAKFYQEYKSAVYSEVLAIIDGQKLYVNTKSTQDDRIFDSYYEFDGQSAIQSLQLLLEDMGVKDVAKYYQDLTQWFNEQGKGQMQSFLQTNKAFINSYLALVVNNFFQSQTTSEGYQFNMNAQGVRSANEYLYTNTIEQGLVEILGDQPLTTIRCEIDEILSVSVGELVNLVEQKLGCTVEEFIDAVWVYFSLPDKVEGVSKEYLKQTICGPAVANVTFGAIVEDYINAGNDYNNRTSLENVLDEFFENASNFVNYTPYQLIAIANGVEEQADLDAQTKFIYDTVNSMATQLEQVAHLNVNTDANGNIKGVKFTSNVDFEKVMENFPIDIQDKDTLSKIDFDIDVEIKIDYTPQKNYDLVKKQVVNKIDIAITCAKLFEEQLTQMGIVCDNTSVGYAVESAYKNDVKYYRAKVSVNENDFLTLTFSESMQLTQAQINVHVFDGYEIINLEIPN